MSGKLYVVGLGPGDKLMRTEQVNNILSVATVIVGYKGYVAQLEGEFLQARRYVTGMTGEVARCKESVELALSGEVVVLVCSGDPGVYGMASLVLQLAAGRNLSVQIVPGITAATSAAALLGAPLGHDFSVISLSDRLTSWELITQRLIAAAKADFCIVLYNPASHGRPDHLKKACDILLRYLPASRPAGWARQIGREGQQCKLCNLGELRDEQVDMFTTCIIGNSHTERLGDWLVTPRGYRELEE